MNVAPDAGVDGATTFDVGGPVGLFASLGGTPDAAAAGRTQQQRFSGLRPAWTPQVCTPTRLRHRTLRGCSATVTVSETTAADAGTDGTLTLCANSPATGLFAELGGTPDAGGSWADPTERAQRDLQPGIRPGCTPHAGRAGPARRSSTVTVSGTRLRTRVDGATTVCDVGGPVGLFAAWRTPDAGGSWTDANNNAFSGRTTGGERPGVHLHGDWRGTVCVATATVTVSETTAADAGRTAP
ncbi:MAG: hypothetical protein R2810_02960 [Flavobacteriales bacterium]